MEVVSPEQYCPATLVLQPRQGLVRGETGRQAGTWGCILVRYKQRLWRAEPLAVHTPAALHFLPTATGAAQLPLPADRLGGSGDALCPVADAHWKRLFFFFLLERLFMLHLALHLTLPYRTVP